MKTDTENKSSIINKVPEKKQVQESVLTLDKVKNVPDGLKMYYMHANWRRKEKKKVMAKEYLFHYDLKKVEDQQVLAL